jgi:hypothetical protein
VGSRKHNLILTDRSLPYVTDMRQSLSSPRCVCVRYDWLISDPESAWLLINDDDGVSDKELAKGPVLISGDHSIMADPICLGSI